MRVIRRCLVQGWRWLVQGWMLWRYDQATRRMMRARGNAVYWDREGERLYRLRHRYLALLEDLEQEPE